MQRQLIARPEVTSLTFQVFDRALHPELIDRLASRSFERNGARLTLHLTTAGHVIEWRWRSFTLVEILADQSNPLPEHRQLFAHRVGGERSELHTPCENVSYQTCFQSERLPAEVYYRLHDELRDEGERGGVLHLMQPNTRLGLAPVSYVDLQARPDSVLIHAYHTYPDEHAIVKTQSLIETVSA